MWKLLFNNVYFIEMTELKRGCKWAVFDGEANLVWFIGRWLDVDQRMIGVSLPVNKDGSKQDQTLIGAFFFFNRTQPGIYQNLMQLALTSNRFSLRPEHLPFGEDKYHPASALWRGIIQSIIEGSGFSLLHRSTERRVSLMPWRYQ